MKLATILAWFMICKAQPTYANQQEAGEFDEDKRSERDLKKKEYEKTIILGAGISGIAAARKLWDSGNRNFIIIEATDRVGGRIKEVELKDGTVIEAGANWVHGSKGPAGTNPIYSLAKKYKLQTVIEEDDEWAVYYKGKRLPDSQVPFSRIDRAYDCFENKKAAVKKNFYSKKGSDVLMSDLFGQCGWTANTAVEKALEWAYIDFDYSISPFDTGVVAKPNDPYGESDYLVNDKRGYSLLVRNLAAPFIDKLIVFNEKVVEVEYSSSGVTIHTRNRSSDSPSTFQGKRALITFSQGVLQRSIGSNPDPVVKFTPALPKWKQDAILSSNMAYYTKIFLQFNSQFWAKANILLLATADRGYFPAWINMNLAGFPGKNMLMATLTGDQSLAAANKTDIQVVQDTMVALRKMYPNAPNPVDFYVSKWVSDEFTYGSYSDRNFGKGSNDAKLLAYPVDNILHFAGEAMHDFAYGTVHGAYMTGLKAAVEINNCYQGRRSCPKKK